MCTPAPSKFLCEIQCRFWELGIKQVRRRSCSSPLVALGNGSSIGSGRTQLPWLKSSTTPYYDTSTTTTHTSLTITNTWTGNNKSESFNFNFWLYAIHPGSYEPSKLSSGSYEPSKLSSGSYEPSKLSSGSHEPSRLVFDSPESSRHNSSTSTPTCI